MRVCLFLLMLAMASGCSSEQAPSGTGEESGGSSTEGSGGATNPTAGGSPDTGGAAGGDLPSGGVTNGGAGGAGMPAGGAAAGSGGGPVDGSGGQPSKGGSGGDHVGENGADSCTTEAQLRVMSFNIRYAGGSALDPNAWNHSTTPRRDRVIATILEHSPDLLGVQEALSSQVADLRSGLPAYGFVGVGRDDGNQAGEFAGVFYHEERFALVQEGHFWLSETPEQPGTVFAGSGSIRMATWVILSDQLTDRELFFLNTHWDNVSQSSREASATLVRNRLGSLAGERPFIVTGDLNQSEDNAALQILLAPDPSATALIDGYRRAHPTPQSAERTYHGFDGAIEGVRIDYVLHGAHFSTVEASILRDEYEGFYPSDHYPVSSLLAWTERPDGAPCP